MTGYAHVLKYNPNGINQYTKGNGDAGGSGNSGSSGGAGGTTKPDGATQKGDLNSASIAGFQRQEQAKNFLTAL